MKLPDRNFTKVPDYVLHACFSYRLTAMQSRVLLWLLSVTLGRKRPNGSPDPQESIEISMGKAAEASGFDRGDLGKALRSLIAHKVLHREFVGPYKTACYSINLKVEEWDLKHDGPRPKSPDLEGKSPSTSTEILRGNPPRSWGEIPLGGEGKSPSLDSGKTASNKASGASLKKKREEERDPPKPPRGLVRAEDLEEIVYRKAWSMLSSRFYPFGGPPPIAQSSLRDFVRAYRDNLRDAGFALQAAADQIEASNATARENGKQPLHHPIKPVLNLAAKLLRDNGINPRPREETA